MANSKKETEELSILFAQANQSLLNCLKKQVKISSEVTVCAQPQTSHAERLYQQVTKLSIFDKIQDFQIDQIIENRISNHKQQLFTPKRRDLLFTRHKRSQEEQIVTQKASVQKRIFQGLPKERFNSNFDLMDKAAKGQFKLHLQALNRTETFHLNSEDMDKLRPENDLNDVIIGTYIKLVQFVYLPLETDQKTHIFSSFFMDKLIGDLGKEQYIYDKDPFILVEQVRIKIKQSYKNVKRWTKKLDIFDKERLVFPINAFRHWFCIFVLNPSSLISNSSQGKQCQIIYCDSMFQRKEFMVQAIRKYLQYQLEDKKSINVELKEENLPSYQLLLPRQTNTHDCGLYMISYIEELLLHLHELQDLSSIYNRQKLRLFPQTLVYSMRQRLKLLFTGLLNAKEEREKRKILDNYTQQKCKIIKEADNSAYDSINEKECKKYEKMNSVNVTATTQEEKSFACKIKFYLDPEINFYEKDK